MYGQVVREGIDIDKQRSGMGTQDAYGLARFEDYLGDRISTAAKESFLSYDIFNKGRNVL